MAPQYLSVPNATELDTKKLITFINFMLCAFSHKSVFRKAWEEDSVAKGTCRSCKGLEFSFHTHVK